MNISSATYDFIFEYHRFKSRTYRAFQILSHVLLYPIVLVAGFSK